MGYEWNVKIHIGTGHSEFVSSKIKARIKIEIDKIRDIVMKGRYINLDGKKKALNG